MSQDITYFVHSWHCKERDRNYVGVVEKIEHTDDNGVVTTTENLRYFQDPYRSYWLTKPYLRRQYDHKKEFEKIENLEMFTCRDSELENHLAYNLGYTMSYRKRDLRSLCQSPYVYGADIPTETLIKQDYLSKTPAGKVATYTRGGFDIETEVRGDKRINIITFIHEHHIYTAALREYCRIYNDGSTSDYVMATEDDCLKVIDRMLGNYIALHHFELTFKICDTELDVIKWIFSCIHKEKTNFIGIWNMGFDLPKVLERIEALGADPAEIMCPPEVPKQFRYVKYSPDHSKNLQHFTDKWDWAAIAGYSQFLDSMCLYARLRKVYGRDPSYSLDDISNKELGQGKLHFGAITNHFLMQNYNFLEYIAYNINDVMIMMLMEWKNNDMRAVAGLCGVSPLREFAHQTTMLRNDAFVYGKAHGHIPASVSTNMYDKFDDAQLKAGGTVLPPNKATGVGTDIVKELPRRSTLAGLYANDLDFSSMYPSTVSSMNVSKETALFTTIKINGYPEEMIESFFSNIIQPEINADYICTTFFGMPDYEEMLSLFEQSVKK